MPLVSQEETIWQVPREEWEARRFATRRLDLQGELAQRGLTVEAEV